MSDAPCSSPDVANDTETNVEPAPRTAGMGGRNRVLDVGDEAAAFEDMLAARLQRHRVCDDLLVVEVLHPFPAVPEGVVETPRVWLLLSHHVGGEVAVVAGDRLLSNLRPWDVTVAASSCRVLPFELRRQPVGVRLLQRVQLLDER